MCWWIRRPASQTETILSDLQTDEQKGLLHQESGSTQPTISTSFSRDNSFDSADDNYFCITGYYSDINLDYSITSSVIGTGHYGTVRQCTHRTTGETFAVKSINKCQVEYLDYLKREVQILSWMDHENIIKMVGCYEDAESVHIVTEKYAGGELFDRIVTNASRDGGCLPEMEAATIIRQLLEAVSYLHKHDCVHLDIKPENILFESSERDSPIRLIDFGFACHHSRDEAKMSTRVGTCQYMAPELLKGDYDRAADIWSVGVIAYILLCGYSPFNGKDDYEISQAIQRGDYKFLYRWDGVSVCGLDFIRCLLEVDASKRLSAEEALAHPWLKLGSLRVSR